jgi:hypothetical protein
MSERTYSEDLIAYIKNAMSQEWAKTLGVPMNLVDGRPWVPTHAEAHPDIVFGYGGYEHCTHPDCPGPDAAPPIGLFNCEGLIRYE